MSGHSQLQVRLYRDSFNTPWGFRLQGGKDLSQALTVQRVFANSPAEGELQRGDVILAIGNQEAAQLTHKQAQDAIKHGGGQVQLFVSRPPPGRAGVPPLPSIQPQRPRAPTLQQPPTMPGAAGYGHMPKKITLSNLGGGGPDFGSDYSRPMSQTAAQRYTPVTTKGVMLNKVQSSLDNITLSPRTPEVPISSPFYQPPIQQYQPPKQQQQQQQQSPAQQYQPQPQQYQPQPQQYQPQQYQPPPQQMYTPTGLLLEQQRLQEQQDEVRTPLNKPPPRIPKPRPAPSSYTDLGVDYSRPQAKKSSASWRPARPVPVPVNVTPDHAPPGWDRQVSEEAAPEPPPAWRTTLKSTGVKPWDAEVNYAPQQEPVRSVPYSSSQPSPRADPGGGPEDGPNVVHLQYNSPIHLYSNANVQETLHGQTQALAGSPQSKPPSKQSQGDRDWSQSAVYRMIQEESRKGGRPAPPTAPKPQMSPQAQQYRSMDEEFGTSDF